MVKALSFKGEKKVKKRKRIQEEGNDDDAPTNKQPPPGHEEVEDDDNWVSSDAVTDIAGPTLLVLPTSPPTSLASDALGKVFALKVENMVEDQPSTAEPHDVRQVWIANRVVGSENSFTFKAHHGRYLGCDQYGLLFATREAVSPEETFKCSPSPSAEGSRFDIQSMRKTYISVSSETLPPEPRGDAKETGEVTGVRIRMQARFKPKHKVEKAEKVRAKISRKELEDEVGRRLEDDEVKKLKKARREGNFHEIMLDVKVKGKHDKFA